MSNAIGGGGSVVKSGTGSVTLSGNNTYSGGTTISGGTLQVGTGGTTGSLGSGAIVDNAALVYNLGNATASLPAGGITGLGTVSVTSSNIGFNGNVVTAGSQSYNATKIGSYFNGGQIVASSVTLSSTGAAAASRSSAISATAAAPTKTCSLTRAPAIARLT